MSTTTVADTEVSPRPRPSVTAPAGPISVVNIRADLLPSEVVAARDAVRTRNRVGFGLVALVALLAAWFGASWWGTRSANDDLAAAQDQAATLQQKSLAYGDLTRVQGELSGIDQQLRQLMAGNVQWATLMGSVRSALPSGTRLTGTTGTMNDATTAGAAANSTQLGGQQVLNTSGKASLGTLTLTGTAPGKPAVAAFVESLAKVKGLAAPLVSDIGSEGSGMTFTVAVLITADAVGGRYSSKSTAHTGGN